MMLILKVVYHMGSETMVTSAVTVRGARISIRSEQLLQGEKHSSGAAMKLLKRQGLRSKLLRKNFSSLGGHLALVLYDGG